MTQAELLFRDPPSQGLTSESLASSESGADAARVHRSKNLTLLRKLWQQPRTLNEIASLSGLPITSVCSLKHALERDLMWVDYQYPTGTRKTKRSRWRIR